MLLIALITSAAGRLMRCLGEASSKEVEKLAGATKPLRPSIVGGKLAGML